MSEHFDAKLEVRKASEKINEQYGKAFDLLSKITPENRHEEIPFSSALSKGVERYSGALERLAEITEVKVKLLHPDAVIPSKAHAADSGFDLVAVEDTIIEPGETALIKTGLAFELPPGCEMQIRPRSGVTLKTKLRVQLGTVDSNYRGEVGVIVDNIFPVDAEDRHDYYFEVLTLNGDLKRLDGKNPYGTYIIRKGDRIAQTIIQRLPDVELIEVEAIGDSERGVKGFGSSGTT